MRAHKARTATCALEIEIRWMDGTTLRQEQFCPPRSFWLKDQPVADGEAACVAERDWLGSDAHELVSVSEDGQVRVHGPRGSVGLKLGERTCLTFGPLSFAVALIDPVNIAGLSTTTFDPKKETFTGLSIALHAFMLGCMALLPPKASSLSLDAIGDDDRYARYLATPVIREEDPLPWEEPKGQEDGETSESAGHKGPEGAAGKPDTPKTDKRMGIQGKNSERLPPKEVTAATAGEQGILGVLRAAAAYAGPTSVYGGEQALGYDPETALGALLGSEIGDNGGFNGLGMRGTGRGGSGEAEGAIGIGNNLTGDMARGSPHGTGLNGLGRKSHVPMVRMRGEAEVRGSLSKEAIRRVIHRNLVQVRACYEQGLSTRPDLAGRVAISFMIAPSGVVQQSTVKESSLGSSAVDDCVAQAVRRWTFPAPDGGGYVAVSYPFMFERSGE
jgi:TonB family protein